ncbi:MAG: glutamate ligase domain-containing protein, partial [Terracidiphilus sp.]
VFQPHRFSRTRDLLEEFGGAFMDADSVIVLPIYAASEEPIAGVTAELLAGRILGPRVEFAPELSAAVEKAVQAAREGDMILTLGAGSVSHLAPQILAALKSHEETEAASMTVDRPLVSSEVAPTSRKVGRRGVAAR